MSELLIKPLSELTTYFAAHMPFIRVQPTKRGQNVLQILHPIIEGKGYIAGSFAAWTSVDQEHYQPGDIDIFCTSLDAVSEICTSLRRLAFGLDTWGETVVSLYPLTGANCPICHPIQLIAPHPNWLSYPVDIIKSFDMDVCRAVVINPETVAADINAGDTIGTILAINSPLRVAKRVLKYHKRGVQFDDQELVKMFLAWDTMTEEQKKRCIDAFLPDDPEPGYAYNADWDDYFFEE